VINWDRYKTVVASIVSSEMESILHDMVRSYLHNQATTVELSELKHLGILLPNEEELKQIVKPFNFMENDRSQEG
jgi:hypothetical protein